LAAVLCAVAGCSYRLDSLFSNDDATEPQGGFGSRATGSIEHREEAAQPPEADLLYARAAAADVLAHGGKGNSVPWHNPHSGAGGNITPLAVSTTDGGIRCRDFLASYVRGTAQAWLQGAACRTSRGQWEVKSLKPIKRS
jgi:surface antigen